MERKEEERVSSKKILVFENKNNTTRICTILSQHRGHRLSESWNLQRFPERGDSKLYVNLTVSLYPREKCYIFPRQQRINRSMLPCILSLSFLPNPRDFSFSRDQVWGIFSGKTPCHSLETRWILG